MNVFSRPEEYSGQASAVALGMFDGVHIGHQLLIRTTVSLARAEGWQAVVSTFDRHPLSVIAPEHAPRALLTLQENIQKMERLGADWVYVQHFDREFAALPPEDFVHRIVVGLNARAIVVGENYTFGRRGAGNAALLEALSGPEGFRCVVVPPVMDGGRMTSSTWIRQLQQAGEAEHARRLMDIPEV